MNPDQIRRRLIGRFQPFILRTSDGREFRVPQPELVAVGKHEVAVVDGNGHIDTLDPRHIVSITSLARITARAGNGWNRPIPVGDAERPRKEATFSGPDLRFAKIGDDRSRHTFPRTQGGWGQPPPPMPSSLQKIAALGMAAVVHLLLRGPSQWLRPRRNRLPVV